MKKRKEIWGKRCLYTSSNDHQGLSKVPALVCGHGFHIHKHFLVLSFEEYIYFALSCFSPTALRVIYCKKDNSLLLTVNALVSFLSLQFSTANYVALTVNPLLRLVIWKLQNIILNVKKVATVYRVPYQTWSQVSLQWALQGTGEETASWAENATKRCLVLLWKGAPSLLHSWSFAENRRPDQKKTVRFPCSWNITF